MVNSWKLFRNKTSLVFTALLAGVINCGYGQDSPPENTPFIVAATLESTSSDYTRKNALFLLLEETFNRAGVEFQLVNVPGKRANQLLLEGKIDGLAARTQIFASNLPGVIIVPEPIMRFEYAVFSKNQNIVADAWESLYQYRIASPAEWKSLEPIVEKAPRWIYAKDVNRLFDHLEKDRVDLVIYGKQQGLRYLKDSPRKDVKVLEPIVDYQDLHILVTEAHADVAAKLDASLKEMKRDGTYDKIVVDIE
jgi:polar amino acid transport system substrate-binding protein